MAIEIDERAAVRLVYAVTLEAIRNARAGDTDAAAWLLEDAGAWLEAAGMREIGRDDLRAAIEDTTPIDKRGQKCYW